jgi:hypothetical protein
MFVCEHIFVFLLLFSWVSRLTLNIMIMKFSMAGLCFKANFKL